MEPVNPEADQEDKAQDAGVELTEPVEPAASGMPGIAMLLILVGVLAIIGGIYQCVQLWPGDAGSGYYWKAEAYTPAITWLFYGLVSGIVFFAGAAALTYVCAIRNYVRSIHERL